MHKSLVRFGVGHAWAGLLSRVGPAGRRWLRAAAPGLLHRTRSAGWAAWSVGRATLGRPLVTPPGPACSRLLGLVRLRVVFLFFLC